MSLLLKDRQGSLIAASLRDPKNDVCPNVLSSKLSLADSFGHLIVTHSIRRLNSAEHDRDALSALSLSTTWIIWNGRLKGGERIQSRGDEVRNVETGGTGTVYYAYRRLCEITDPAGFSGRSSRDSVLGGVPQSSRLVSSENRLVMRRWTSDCFDVDDTTVRW